MNDNLNLIIFILDRSGSMGTIKEETIGGYNSFLKGQKEGPGEANFTLILFDNLYEVVYTNKPLAEVPELNGVTFQPRGMTALYDAVGKAIHDTGKNLAMWAEVDRPGKVIVAILTDGHENSSKEYSREQLSAMISHQQEKYGWEFIFVGANMDAPEIAQSISIPASNARNFMPSPDGTRDVFQYVTESSNSFRVSTQDKSNDSGAKKIPTKTRSSGGL